MTTNKLLHWTRIDGRASSYPPEGLTVTAHVLIGDTQVEMVLEWRDRLWWRSPAWILDAQTQRVIEWAERG